MSLRDKLLVKSGKKARLSDRKTCASGAVEKAEIATSLRSSQ